MTRWDELAPKVDVGSVDDCWPWKGHVDRDGYGRIGVRCAHREVYRARVGEIPPGHELDHLCRNRLCVNPAHLQPVLHHVNVQRGIRVIRTHCKYGHPRTPENTYSRQGKYGPIRQCKPCTIEGTRRRREAARRKSA